jgi:threonine/homoserine/homoserine lactone efflux protein
MSAASGNPVSAIKETSSRLKQHILFSAYLWWGGVIWVFVTLKKAKWPSVLLGAGGLLLLVGFVWYSTTKLRLWRHRRLHRRRRLLPRR